MTESQAWSSLREALVIVASELGHAIHIVRVENLVGIGTFDSNACFHGKEFWLEGKHLPRLPVRPTTLVKVGLREEQRTFALRRLLCGSPCWLWCRVSMGRKGADNGAGWYLFCLDSVDKIDKLRLGMTLPEFMRHKHGSAKSLALNLFNSLFPELINAKRG